MKRIVKPRNAKLAKLQLRWFDDEDEYERPYWALTCGGAVVVEFDQAIDATGAQRAARVEQKEQWRLHRIASELTFYNKNGTPMSGPGSRTTWPRSADPKRSKG